MIKEYFNLAKDNISRWKSILYGFYKDLIFFRLLREEQNAILNKRDICIDCLSRSYNAKKNGYKSKRFDDHCTICKCNIRAKTASDETNCLINMW